MEITAKDIREAVANLPDDAKVKLSIEATGNNLSPDIRIVLFNVAYVKTDSEMALYISLNVDDVHPEELYGDEFVATENDLGRRLAEGEFINTEE